MRARANPHPHPHPSPSPSPSPNPNQARFLMGCEPVKVLAMGSCQVSDVQDLEGPEAYDTATIVVRFENGSALELPTLTLTSKT